jgi:phosphohistidine phosphatase
LHWGIHCGHYGKRPTQLRGKINPVTRFWDKKNKMTQTLYLLRHAKAEAWSPGVDDFGRKLSQQGHEHMSQLSAWMSQNLPAPGRALCSPSQRTRGTFAPFLQTWPELNDRVFYSPEIYEATTGTLHELLGSSFLDSQCVMMVGHNPAFENLALAVLRDSDAATVTKMATGTLAVIDFDPDYEAGCGSATLRQWIPRKNLLRD